MPSLLPNYQYDLFISYRHKDNKGDHWVTEFVNALKTELESTFKEDISIYFDENPHDGLLETHNVDKSLEGKLRCLIFIPIISQTYCDTKSFAWQHEFCAFNKLAKEDQFGRDIKLSNGNVASRILPIKIHDLDAEDKSLLESELGGVLRAIEFIYKEAGVNRPLRLNEENPIKNLNQTGYRNQVNKVANAIKDIIIGMKNPGTGVKEGKKTELSPVSLSFRKKTTLIASVLIILGIAFAWFYYRAGWGETLASTLSKSIAVLPFENMNHDPEQDYFSNGIAEDILNHLVKISDLKVKSRTSTLQYKGTQKSMTEIGNELNVENIVEGSVRRVGDQVRIVVQLIDAKTDLHLWSETYDRDLKDVLALQSEIAIEIANALEARLTSSEKQNITKVMSKDVTAYDYFLKAREIANKGVLLLEKKDFEDALSLVNRSLQLDPDFAQAMALKGGIWFNGSYIGIENNTWQDSALYFASKAIKTDPASPDGYLLRASILRFVGKSNDGESDYHKAYELAPNNPEILYPYGWQLLREENERGADLVIQAFTSQYKVQDPEYYTSLSDIYYFLGDELAEENALKKAKSLDPGSAGPVLGLSGLYWRTGQYDKGIAEVQKFHSIERWGVDRLGWLHFLKKDYKNAIVYWGKYKEIEAGFIGKTQTVPFRHRLGMAYAKLGNKAKADSLFQEHLQINQAMISGARSFGTWDGLGGAYYDQAACLAYFGKEKEALQSLDSALLYGFNWNWGYHNDPVIDNLRKTDQFKALIKRIDDDNAFRKRAFSNAYNRAQASDELKNILK